MLEKIGNEINELINSISDLYDENVELKKQIEAAKELINTHKFKDKYDRELLECLGGENADHNI